MTSDLDMYADDFDEKEKEKLVNTSTTSKDESEKPSGKPINY